MQTEKLNEKQRRLFDKVYYPFANEAMGVFDIGVLREMAARHIRQERLFFELPLEHPEDALLEELFDCERAELEVLLTL